MENIFSPESPLPQRTPEFDNLLKVLRCETPDRPTLFEFFMNAPLYQRLVAHLDWRGPTDCPAWLLQVKAFEAAGYDYATLQVPGFLFPVAEHGKAETASWNETSMIGNRESFDSYPWPDPAAANYGLLDEAAEYLPAGMKFVVPGPGGVLENVVQIVGYQNLCLMIMDNEQLVYDIFEGVGCRLVEYYRRVRHHRAVGACISNDDWGFKSQTMLAPADMRRFVFPWHKKIVETVHASGKPVILHSCGYYREIIDDVIDDVKFDGRHSYEDAIVPVENAYEELHGRIGIMGGIDVDFLCRRRPEEVYERAKAMLNRSAGRGGYALGSGNSIPEYVPDKGYIALLRAALDGE